MGANVVHNCRYSTARVAIWISRQETLSVGPPRGIVEARNVFPAVELLGVARPFFRSVQPTFFWHFIPFLNSLSTSEVLRELL